MAKKKKTAKKSKKTTKTPEVEIVEETPKADPEPEDEFDYTDEFGIPKVAEPEKEEEKEQDTPDKEIEVKPVAIDDDLLTRAVKVGMSISEARSLGTDEALTTALVAIERAKADVPKTTTATEAEAPVVEFKLDLDPDVYDEDVIKAVNKVAEGLQSQFQSQLKAMQAKQDSVVDELQKQRQHDSDLRTDGMFTGLGGDWEDVFGTGPTSALRKSSQHAKNRAKVTDHMAMVEAGAKALGKTVPEDLFHDTVESVFSDESTTIADAATGDAVTARKSQALVPPTAREGKPLSREEQTVQNLRERMEDSGLEPTDDGYDYDEESKAFPD